MKKRTRFQVDEAKCEWDLLIQWTHNKKWKRLNRHLPELMLKQEVDISSKRRRRRQTFTPSFPTCLQFSFNAKQSDESSISNVSFSCCICAIHSTVVIHRDNKRNKRLQIIHCIYCLQQMMTYWRNENKVTRSRKWNDDNGTRDWLRRAKNRLNRSNKSDTVLLVRQATTTTII